MTGVFVCHSKRKLFIVGRKIAIDASMCLYQFLIAVRAEGLLNPTSNKMFPQLFSSIQVLS